MWLHTVPLIISICQMCELLYPLLLMWTFNWMLHKLNTNKKLYISKVILIEVWRAVCEPLSRFQSIVNPRSRSWGVRTATTEIYLFQRNSIILRATLKTWPFFILFYAPASYRWCKMFCFSITISICHMRGPHFNIPVKRYEKNLYKKSHILTTISTRFLWSIHLTVRLFYN